MIHCPQAIEFLEGDLAGKEVPYALHGLMYPEDKKNPVVRTCRDMPRWSMCASHGLCSASRRTAGHHWIGLLLTVVWRSRPP